MRFFLISALLLLPFIAAQEDIFQLDTIDVKELLHNYKPPKEFEPLTEIATEVENLLGLNKNSWHECRPCVKHIADHIVNGTVVRLAVKCMSTKNPVWKKRCEWMHHHQNETLGFVVTKIRPVHDGYVFCEGARQCPIHKQSVELIDYENAWNFDDILIQNQLTDYVTQLPSNETYYEDEDDMEELLDELDFDEYNEPPGQRCQRCTTKATHNIMKHAELRFKRYCDKTKCPKMKKFCAWAHEHKGFLKGSLYAQIDPWKYAVGFCVGHGDCKKRSEVIDNFFDD